MEQKILVGLWAPSVIDNSDHILIKQKWRASGTGKWRAWLAHNHPVFAPCGKWSAVCHINTRWYETIHGAPANFGKKRPTNIIYTKQ